jgi:hypothetical protein
LADEAERAAEEAARKGGSDASRWPAVPLAVRTWALERPHEWGLLFGSPVPGYHAPEETVEPYVRLASAFVRPVAEAYRGDRLLGRPPAIDAATPPDAAGDAALGAALAPVREALLADAPTSIVVQVLQAWCALIGSISLELFGHWRNTVLDPELFFTRSVATWGHELGLAM